MKKISTLTVLFFVTVNIFAQDYNISFAGTGAANIIDSVRVEYLSRGISFTILGSDILHLGTVGINDIQLNENNAQVFPNPMMEKAKLSFYAKQYGIVRISIFDISGKKILQTNDKYNQGTQIFELSGLKQGVYFINISGENYYYNVKLISANPNYNEAKIEYIKSGIPENAISSYKSSKSTINLAYTPGDRLLFKGYSGIYSTIITDIPSATKTITFTLSACTDFDNNNYSIVKIGSQTWMAENLNTTHYRNGDTIAHIVNNIYWSNDTLGAYCNYNNNEIIGETYGKMYNWKAVANTSNLCPTGWHLPTDAEWTTLINFLGGEGDAGGKLKETGTLHWINPNTGATNESGFTAYPSGYRNSNGTFNKLGEYGYWWSSSQENLLFAWCRILSNNTNNSTRASNFKDLGLAVRCIKN